MTHIDYIIQKCFLGQLLIAKTEQGICNVAIADDPKILIDYLQHLYREVKLIKSTDQAFQEIIEQVLSFSSKNKKALKLDIKGTVFQKQVWAELEKIPVGRTTTYKEIAKNMGKPQAFRAVARACATNKIAILIPCHRVIASNGALSGYRWGIERKKMLLERELEN